MKKIFSVLAALVVAGGCAVSGQVGEGRAFSITQMEGYTALYYREFYTNEKISNNAKQDLRASQCVVRALTRAVDGAFAGLRTEWNVDMLRECRMNAALLDTGTFVVSNCIPSMLNNQDQTAYIIAHAFAHSLLEHDNQRASLFLKDLSKQEGFDFKQYLRTKEGYAQFTKAVGLIDVDGRVTPYTEEQERQADIIALQMMAKAGFNPSSVLVLWQNMRTNPDLHAKAYMQMHPHTDQNLQELSLAVQKLAPVLQQARKDYGRFPQCQ